MSRWTQPLNKLGQHFEETLTECHRRLGGGGVDTIVKHVTWVFDLVALLPIYKTGDSGMSASPLTYIDDSQLLEMTCQEAETHPWIQWQWLAALARHVTVPCIIQHGVYPWTFGQTDDIRRTCLGQLEPRTKLIAQNFYLLKCTLTEPVAEETWTRIARMWIAQQVWFSTAYTGQVKCPTIKPLPHFRVNSPSAAELCKSHSSGQDFRADALSQLAVIAHDRWNHIDTRHPLVVWSDTPETLLVLIDAARQWHFRNGQWPKHEYVYLYLPDEQCLIDVAEGYRMFHDHPLVSGHVHEAIAALYISENDDALPAVLMQSRTFLQLTTINPSNVIEWFLPIWVDIWKKRAHLNDSPGTLTSVMASSRMDLFYFVAHLKQAGLDCRLFRLGPYHGLSRWITYTYPIRNLVVRDSPVRMVLTETSPGTIETDPNVFIRELETCRWFCKFGMNDSPPTWYRL